MTTPREMVIEAMKKGHATRTYSAALYQLADQIEAEGVMTIDPETIRQAAQRLDEQTVCINYLKKRLPDGWNIRREGDSIVVTKPYVGGYVANKDKDNIASEILYYLASDMLSAAPAAPAVPDDVVKDSGIAGFKPWPAKHLKTGNEYRVIGEAIDATNATEGRTMVIYRGNGHTFVREAGEFTSKFAAMQEGLPA